MKIENIQSNIRVFEMIPISIPTPLSYHIGTGILGEIKVCITNSFGQMPLLFIFIKYGQTTKG